MNIRQVWRSLTYGDKILICGLLLISVFSFPFVRNVARKGNSVQIEVDGTVFDVVSLATDRTVEVTGPLGKTYVIIHDGEAHVSDSPCRAKICVRTGQISRTGQLIVCVPNKVVVRIIGQEELPYDAVTQ